MAPAERSPGVIAGTVQYGGVGVGAGGVIGAVSAGMNPMTPAAAKGVVFQHAVMLGGCAAVFGATEGMLDGMFGPSLKNKVAAGAASGALLGLKSKSLSGAAFGAGMFAMLQFSWGIGKESYDDGFFR